MRLIIGLGNPGSEYERTRHNVGFMVIDHLVERHQFEAPKMKFHAAFYDGQLLGHRCALLKPMTYMNRSGTTVREAMQFYKLDPDDILIVVDDIALPVGTIRLRPSGSAGNHNGLLDIEGVLATRNYPRLRVGIDPPGLCQQLAGTVGIEFFVASMVIMSPSFKSRRFDLMSYRRSITSCR